MSSASTQVLEGQTVPSDYHSSQHCTATLFALSAYQEVRQLLFSSLMVPSHVEVFALPSSTCRRGRARVTRSVDQMLSVGHASP